MIVGLGYGVHEARLRKLSAARVKKRRERISMLLSCCLAECRELRAGPLHMKR